MLAVLVAVLLATGLVTVIVRRLSDDVERALAPSPSTSTGGAATSTTTTTGPSPSTTTAGADQSTPDITGPPADQVGPLRILGAQVAEVRGLRWRRPLHVKLGTRAELSARLSELTDEELKKTGDRLLADEASLKMLKLIPAGLDYRKTIEDLLAGTVLGFYDDETKELFVGTPQNGKLDPATRSTLSHEMTHAITDQNFDFGVRTKALDDAQRTEELGAWTALIEGDAEVVRGLWSDRYLSAGEQLQAAIGSSGAGSPPDVPRYIEDALVFPYTDGTAFVNGLYRRGGFAAVDAAYRNPPTSIEQIFHPGLYAQSQGWTAPPFPDLAATTGCVRVDTGVMGEFDMRQLLYDSVGAGAAVRAAAGWNGDSFTLVKCGSQRGLAERWQTDAPGDSARLAQALAKWSQGWSGGAAPDGEGRFSGPGGHGRIVSSGSRVDFVIADDADAADRVFGALAAA